MLNIIKNTINRVFASGVDSDASAFITATGLSGTTQKSAITTLVKDLKSSGLWSKMKAVYPMVTDNRNLLSYTEDFSNAVWTNNNLTVSTNSTNSPINTLTADTLTPSTSNVLHFVQNAIVYSAGTQVLSVYAKSNGYNFVAIGENNGTAWAYFNLSNGTVGNTNNAVSTSIENVGNGWYRCSLTYTSSGGTKGAFILCDSVNGNLSAFAGNGTSGIYVWGAQLEAGALSTYQPILTTPSAFMASQMKYNLKDARDLDAAFRLTWSGGWTYSATGATPNGTNAYANPYLNLNIISSGLAHMSYYSRSNTNVGYEWGSIDGWPTTALFARSGGATSTYFDGQAYSVYSNTDGNGLYLGQKNSSTENSGYKNGTKILSKTGTVSYANGKNVYISRWETTYGNKQCAFASLGELLSDQENLLLNQIVEKYQVALSRGVQAAQSFYYNSAYSNEANTYLYSTQITGTTQVSAINTLINGLKANNLWTKMKAVYPFVTDYRNLLAYTEDFANAYWQKDAGVSATANTTTAPDGTNTADTIVLPADTGSAMYLLPGVLASNQYTVSFYIKATSGQVGNTVCFRTNPTAIANNITLTNDWVRYTFTVTPTSTPWSLEWSRKNSATATSFYLWGAQLELGSTASTYQPVLAANNYATNVAAQMKFNLVNPQDTDAAFRLAFSGGWTYSTNGAQPNGTNGYADTKLNPSISLSTSSAHLSFYSRTNSPSSGYTGYELAIGHYSLITQFQGNTFYSNLEGAGAYNGSYTSTNGLGHFIASRINNTTTQGFKNGSKVINVTQNSTLVNGNLLISSRGGGNYSDKQTAFATIGDGLSDAEAALLYQLIQQYQTDLSRQV